MSVVGLLFPLLSCPPAPSPDLTFLRGSWSEEGLSVQFFVEPSLSEDTELWGRFNGDFWVSGWAMEYCGWGEKGQCCQWG